MAVCTAHLIISRCCVGFVHRLKFRLKAATPFHIMMIMTAATATATTKKKKKKGETMILFQKKMNSPIVRKSNQIHSSGLTVRSKFL